MCDGRKEGRRAGGREGRNLLILPLVRGKYREGGNSNETHLECAAGFCYETVICKLLQNMLILNFSLTSQIKVQNKIFPYKIACTI